jgi:hypothetical protein
MDRIEETLSPVDLTVEEKIAELAKETVSDIRNPQKQATRKYRQKRKSKNKIAAQARKRNRANR